MEAGIADRVWSVEEIVGLIGNQPELEAVMANVITPDRQAMFIRLVLAILGGALLVIGWYRWGRFSN